jgi:hypothetical protein
VWKPFEDPSYLCLGFTTLLPEHHHLHAVTVHVLHLLVGRNQSPSKFCVCSQKFCNVEFCKVDIILSIPLQTPNKKCMSAHSSFVNILTTTPQQQNTATLA